VPCQFLAAWLAERINPYRTLALGLALWSAATIACGFAGGLAALIGLRIVLGLGESAAFPCASKLLARHMPQHSLGVANGMIGLGISLGPAFGGYVGGLLLARTGWRDVFLLFGAVSLLWLVPWLLRTRQPASLAAATTEAPAPPWSAILARREVWGACLGHFAANYTFYFLLSWLPLYLVKYRGFTLVEVAGIVGTVYLIDGCTTALAGFVSDAWMRAGASANLARKTFALIAQLIMAASLGACVLGDRTICLASLFVAGVGMGLNHGGVYAIAQTLAGPRAAGKWVGLQNAMGNTAGIVGPLITGWAVDRTGTFLWPFFIAGGVALAGAVGWCVIIRKVEPLDWSAA
jgi:MFS family permease